MNINNLKKVTTSAGLKIYCKDDGSNPEWIHIKTVQKKYESVLINLDWVKNMHRITPTPEERLYLETKLVLYNLDWPNPAQRDFVNKQEPVSVRFFKVHNGEDYYTVLITDGVRFTDVRVPKGIGTFCENWGIPIEKFNRIQ